MNAEYILKNLDQLSRSDKVTLARRLLTLTRPDKSQKFDFPTSMQFIANAKVPPEFKYPIGHMLLEADKATGGDRNRPYHKHSRDAVDVDPES
jgi:hypothetical protein